nr:unnamed protein product [Callosobruchus chinensis]
MYGELLPLLPCLYLMQSREGQARLVTSHSSTNIQTDSAPPS